MRRRILQGLKWGGLIVFVFALGAFVWAWRTYSEERILLNHFRTAEEETYLVLFQNHLELRPTGGFIGNFAEVTIKEGNITEYRVINANDFDYNKPGQKPPRPLREVLNLPKQQMRDANWNADFSQTARVVRELYHKEGGDKDIAGVIGVTSHVLPKLMEYTGPVSVEGVDKTFTAENVLWEIQKELNFGYLNNPDRSRANRKRPLKRLVRMLENELRSLTRREKLRVASDLYTLAEENQILFSFQNPHLQQQIESLRWGGRIQNAEDGYLYVVDANLGALKTDRFIEREWSLSESNCSDSRDLCGTLQLTYTNTAEKPSKLNTWYRSYTRVYLPEGAFVEEVRGIKGDPRFDTKHNKKETGFLFRVPVGESKTIHISYTRPPADSKKARFLIQKQPGVDKIPVRVSQDGRSVEKTIRTNHLFTFE